MRSGETKIVQSKKYVVDAPKKFPTQRYIVTAPTGINLRYTPEINGKISHMLFLGDRIDVVEIKGEWAQVLCGDKTLYIYASYISK